MHRACGLAYLCFTLSYERRGSPSRAWARQSPTKHPKRVTKVRTGDRAPRLMPLVADRSRDGAPRCASGCDRGPQPPLVYGSARARGYDADRALEALSHRGLPGGRPGVRRKTPARTFQGPLNPPARGRYGILLSRSATRLSRRDVVERERIVMVEPSRTGMAMSSSGSHATPRCQRGVRCELDPTAPATCLLRATRLFHAGVDVDHRKPRIVAETNGTNGVQADHPLVQRRSAECGTAASNVSDRVCYWSLSCGPNYAGAPGQEPLMDDEDVPGWIREQAAGVRCLFSVCTGALICGAAGLLKGLPPVSVAIVSRQRDCRVRRRSPRRQRMRISVFCSRRWVAKLCRRV